jgi:glycine betaine/choline ABC-type transport system substrate-binding protein
MGSDGLPDYSKSRAVLIGTSDYQDVKFPQLPAAANSLEGMRQILTNPELCGWPANRVTQLPNQSGSHRLIIKLREWALDTTGVFLVYYVGHGTPEKDGPCLTLTDTVLEHPDITGVEYRHVRRALLNSTARVKIVILDCCYAGRAIPPVQSGRAHFTDISGTYVMAAADHAAHVPDDQLACTSFTGELLDLVRKGIEDGPEALTLDEIYRRLRTRLRGVDLPDPNSGGTDTASSFPFARNAAYREGPPIPRFPQEPEPVSPWWRRSWRMWGSIAVTAALLTGAGVYAGARLDGPGPSCGPSAGTPALPAGEVAIGSDSDTDPEDQLIAQIYADALQDNGVHVEPVISSSPREVYYDQVCSGALTIVPEYNGALLTTSVGQGSTAITTTEVDDALDQELPPTLEILTPAPAQDKDSITVTQATADRYKLKSIANLSRVADLLTLGASPEFDGREQGTTGLEDMYRVVFKTFIPLNYSGNPSAPVDALVQNKVQAADVYTTNPEIKADHLVVLTDPKDLFRAENVVPLVYKPALQADPSIATVLDYISLRLTQPQLLELNVKAAQQGANLATIASDWARANGPSS